MPKPKTHCTFCVADTRKFIVIDEGSESIPVCPECSEEGMWRQFDKIYDDKFMKPLVKMVNTRFN